MKVGHSQLGIPGAAFMTQAGELITEVATTRVVRFEIPEPPDHVVRFDHYHLNLTLTPRPLNMRACYRGRWGAHHFERVGDVFLIPPGEEVHMKGDGSATHASIICEVNAERLHEWIGCPIEWNDRRPLTALAISNGPIRHAMRRLAEEARNPGLGSDKMIELLSGILVMELGRYCDAIADIPVSGGLASWRLRVIDDRLKVVGDPPTLPELANMCSISVRQLTRGFRTSRGCTIGDYVTQSRIENAKRLLSGGDSIKSIAHVLGFASASSFSFAFRRVNGLTPRQFLHRVYQSKENKAEPDDGSSPA